MNSSSYLVCVDLIAVMDLGVRVETAQVDHLDDKWLGFNGIKLQRIVK